MKTHPLQTLNIPTSRRDQMVEITGKVQQVVSAVGLRDGMAIVHVPHTTAAVTINENADPDVKHDMLRKLAEMIPHHEPYYRHGEGNSDSHVKTSLVGNMITVLVEDGQLVLGHWQGIQFCEFDGPRQRKLQVKLLSFD